MTKIVDDYVVKIDDLEQGGPITTLCKDIAAVLERNFPGWLWAIEPEPKQGIVNIYSLRLSGKFAYTIHLANVQNDPTLKAVLIGGGEILERFGFRRGAYSVDAWMRKEKQMGVMLPNVSDLSKFEQRRAWGHKVETDVKNGHARLTTDPRIGAALRSMGRA